MGRLAKTVKCGARCKYFEEYGFCDRMVYNPPCWQHRGGATLKPKPKPKPTGKSKKVLALAKTWAKKGVAGSGDCWLSCQDLYAKANYDAYCVYSIGGKTSSGQPRADERTDRKDPMPGDILQVIRGGSPTGEHSVIFDHKENGNVIVWNSPGGTKPWKKSTYKNPKITIIWEPRPNKKK